MPDIEYTKDIVDMVDINALSEQTGVAVNTLRYYRQVGIGPKSFRLGRRVMYAVEDVNAWIAEARESASA